MNLMNAISLRIKKLLQEKNINCCELAKLSGLSKQTIYNLLGNKNSYVKVKTLAKISKALNMKLYEFFDDKNINEAKKLNK